jgi:hypothetical protein
MLFLLAGSLIHVCSSAQSLYRLKSSCSLLKSLFAISLLLSLLNFSKELILHYAHLSLCLASHFYVFSFSIIVTVAYSLKLFYSIFSATTTTTISAPAFSPRVSHSVPYDRKLFYSIFSHSVSSVANQPHLTSNRARGTSASRQQHYRHNSRIVTLLLTRLVRFANHTHILGPILVSCFRPNHNIYYSFSSFVLISYALTVLVVDSLFAAVFSSVSLSYNSFSLASTLAISLVPVPLNLYMLVFAFSVSFAFYAISARLASLAHARSLTSFSRSAIPNLTSFVTHHNPLRSWNASLRHSQHVTRFAQHVPYIPSNTLGHGNSIVLRSVYSHFPERVRGSHFILALVNPLRSIINYFNLLSLTYSSYLIFLLEFISFSSAPAYSTRFAFLYAFIPFAIICLILL